MNERERERERERVSVKCDSVPGNETDLRVIYEYPQIMRLFLFQLRWEGFKFSFMRRIHNFLQLIHWACVSDYRYLFQILYHILYIVTEVKQLSIRGCANPAKFLIITCHVRTQLGAFATQTRDGILTLIFNTSNETVFRVFSRDVLVNYRLALIVKILMKNNYSTLTSSEIFT